MTNQAYPLSWPAGWPRTEPRDRQRAQFRTRSRETSQYGFRGYRAKTVAEAVAALLDELDKLGAEQRVISTNLKVKNDGTPYSAQRDPDDPGAAVYFRLDGKPIVFACDKWLTVADNIYAMAIHVNAMRGMDRWGVGNLSQAFAGYAALPAAGQTAGEAWWSVLGFTTGIMPNDKATAVVLINEAYRAKARTAHPDAGGSDFEMAKVNAARDEGLRVIGVKA